MSDATATDAHPTASGIVRQIEVEVARSLDAIEDIVLSFAATDDRRAPAECERDWSTAARRELTRLAVATARLCIADLRADLRAGMEVRHV